MRSKILSLHIIFFGLLFASCTSQKTIESPTDQLRIALGGRTALVTSNILQRTFQVKIGNSTGSAFTVERNGRQYLVSAAHVLSPLTKGANLELKNNGKWTQVAFNIVGFSDAPIDIGVVALDRQISPLHPVNLVGAKSVILSENLFFLGYPYGLEIESGTLNGDYPIPLVKKGICAGFYNAAGIKPAGLYLDAMNNPGFSGGPVVNGATNPISIVGVVSGYQSARDQVVDADGKNQNYFYQFNTGIMIAYDLNFAVELIDKNPIGVPVN